MKTYVFYCNKCRKNTVVQSDKLEKPMCCGSVTTLHAIKTSKNNNIPDYVKQMNKE